MDNSHRNYTPLSLDGARPRGPFMTSSLKRNLMAVGGVLVLVVMVGIGALALYKPKTLVTPAQTVIACPEGYNPISANISDADAIRAQCPGGDVVVVDGPTSPALDTKVDAGSQTSVIPTIGISEAGP